MAWTEDRARAALVERLQRLSGQQQGAAVAFSLDDDGLPADVDPPPDAPLDDEPTLEEIREVRSALSRMDAGTYGRCTACGADIEPARLAAEPHLASCASCART